MHQTQGSRCIEEAKMIIGTATDVANVGGESELRDNRDTQILALLDRSESGVTNHKWERGNKKGTVLGRVYMKTLLSTFGFTRLTMNQDSAEDAQVESAHRAGGGI